MLLVDDILLRSAGISVGPLDMLWIMERIADHITKEMYDPEKIMDDIKVNRELFELGDITEQEYARRQEELLGLLKALKEESPSASSELTQISELSDPR
jgi:hypothetical protein